MAIKVANYQATLEFDASEFKKGMKEADSSFDSFKDKLPKDIKVVSLVKY